MGILMTEEPRANLEILRSNHICLLLPPSFPSRSDPLFFFCFLFLFLFLFFPLPFSLFSLPILGLASSSATDPIRYQIAIHLVPAPELHLARNLFPGLHHSSDLSLFPLFNPSEDAEGQTLGDGIHKENELLNNCPIPGHVESRTILDTK